MGTRINVLLDHKLADWRNRESVLARLATALPAALAVQEYWLSADPRVSHDKLTEWRADPVSPGEPSLRRYTGPGSLFLTLTAHAACIHTGGRWRGFLSIDPLRRVHLAAFRQLTASLGSHSMAVYAASCEVNDLFWGGGTQWEGVELMERLWGPPQRSVENIEPGIVATAKRTVPLVWFLESSQVIAEPG